MAESDLDYARVTGRFGITVGDTDDEGENPDIIWITQGRLLLTPRQTFTKVAAATPSPATLGQGVIECTFVDGYLTYRGLPRVYVVDLTSPKVNPVIGPDLATHRVTILDARAADGTAVTFPPYDVRLTAAGADGDGVNDLTLLAPVVPGESTPITRGPQGTSVQTLTVEAGDLVATFDDGTEVNAGALPVGPGGSDEGVASYYSNEASATVVAARQRFADDINTGAGPLGTALSASIDVRVDEVAPGVVADLTAFYVPDIAPDQGTDVTSQLASAYADAAGRTVRLDKPGVYLVDGLRLTTAGRFEVGAGVTLKLKDGAVGASSSAAVVQIATSGVTFVCEGTLDGNRAGQDIAAYNAAGGTGTKPYAGVRVHGSPGAYLSDVHVEIAHAVNVVDFPLEARYLEDTYLSIIASDCGRGPSIVNCRRLTVPLSVMTSLDNLGAKMYPHGLSLNDVTDSRFGIVSVEDQFGDDDPALGTTLSEWITGATMHQVFRCSFDQVSVVTRADAAQNRGVGVELSSVEYCRFGRVAAYGYTDTNLEWGGVSHCFFGHIDLDGRYQQNKDGIPGGRGLTIAAIGYYPNYLSRTMRMCEYNIVAGFTIRRHFAAGIDLRAGRHNTFSAGHAFGNAWGVYSRILTTSGDYAFVNQPNRDPLGNTFIGCSFHHNERSGYDIQDGSGTTLQSCRAWNNGQSKTTATQTTRGGTSTSASNMQGMGPITATSGVAKSRIRFLDPVCYDDQDFTEYLSGTSATGATLSAWNPERFVPGQTIKLAGAGVAGADLITRINSVGHDEITVETAPSTFPTIVGTGTISTSGTTVTGVGTAFLTQIRGRTWIAVGGVLRQIVSVSSNTSATLSSSFSPNLSGAAFTIHRTTAVGLPSQEYGVRVSADAANTVLEGGTFYGNTVLPVLNLSSTLQDALAARRQHTKIAGSQATMDIREVSNSSVGTSSGSIRLTFFTATETLSVSSVRTNTGAAGAGATPTLCKAVLYELSEDRTTLTKVAETANDTSLWAASQTRYSQGLTGSYTLKRGRVYAGAVLVVSGATTPNWNGVSGINAAEATDALASAQLTGQTDAPASIAVGSLSPSSSQIYMAFL